VTEVAPAPQNKPIRRIAIIGTGIAGFASGGMALQTVALRYKRKPRQERIREDGK
jgi:hypothetical protein